MIGKKKFKSTPFKQDYYFGKSCWKGTDHKGNSEEEYKEDRRKSQLLVKINTFNNKSVDNVY